MFSNYNPDNGVFNEISKHFIDKICARVFY